MTGYASNILSKWSLDRENRLQYAAALTEASRFFRVSRAISKKEIAWLVKTMQRNRDTVTDIHTSLGNAIKADLNFKDLD